MDPQTYDAWYHDPRGCWIGDTEFALLLRLLMPGPGARLLDVGCGTGYFSRRFQNVGLTVTGVDPDAAMLAFAARQGGGIDYLEGDARALPFADGAFDYVAAITSLCFVAEPERALRELWRVSRRGVVLGLLNRASLLYHRKHGRGAYAGARWDRPADVRDWIAALPGVHAVAMCTAIFLPGGGAAVRIVERILPNRLACGGFLAAYAARA